MDENNTEKSLLLEEFAKLNQRLSSIEYRLQNIEQNTAQKPFAKSESTQEEKDKKMIAMLMEQKYGKKSENSQTAQTMQSAQQASEENAWHTAKTPQAQNSAENLQNAQPVQNMHAPNGSQISIQNEKYFTLPNGAQQQPAQTAPPARPAQPMAQAPQQAIPPNALNMQPPHIQKGGKATMDYGQLYGSLYSQLGGEPIKTEAPQGNAQQANNMQYANMANGQGQAPYTAKANDMHSTPQTKAKAKTNLETKLVKNVVSVAAAILIFAGLASLAVLVYDQLPSVMRVALMFVFSFGLAGIGFFASKKKQSVLGTALIASGIGGTYISLLSTYIFFGMLNQYAFFALTGVLAVATLFIPKHYNNAVYGIIGIIAVVVSAALGFSNYNTDGEFLFLTIYFVILSAVFLFFTARTTLVARYVIIIAAAISTWVLSNFAIVVSNFDYALSYPLLFATILLLCFNLTLVVYGTKINHYLTDKTGLNVVVGGFLTIISTFVAQSLVHIISLTVDGTVPVSSEMQLIMLIILFVFAQGAFLEGKTYILGQIYSSVLIYEIAFLWGSSIFENSLPIIGYLPVILPVAIYAIFKSNKVFFIHALVILGVSSNLALFYIDDNAFALGLQLLSIVLAFALCYTNPVIQKTKVALYFLTLNITFLFANEATSMAIKAMTNSTRLDPQGAYLTDVYALSATALVTILFCLRNFAGKSETLQEAIGKLQADTRKTTLYLIFKVINTLLLLSLMFYLQNLHINDIAKMFIVLVTAVQMFIGLRDALDIKNKKWSGFYIGIKFTVYLNYVLYSFIDYSEFAYLMSIICLALAIASIFFGFHKEILSFRLFGLYLSLISVLKLLLVDISYENSLLRVGSFIFSGILCYGIVYLYQKKTKEETEEIEQG